MSSHVTNMHAHSPASYSLSLMIHGVLGAALLLSAYFFNDARKKSDGIFEVVAGPGDNWAATDAPARAESGLPDMPAITITPPTPTPAPEPSQTQPPAPVPQDALVLPPSKTTPKQPPKKADPKQPPIKAAPPPMTKAEFDKLYGKKNEKMRSNIPPPPPKTAPKNPPPPVEPVKPKPITANTKGLVDGVDGGTGDAPGAGGRALTVAERDQLDAYLATLADRIKQAQENPAGVSMELVARVEYYVYADGTIGAVKIIKSSGNRAFDDSVMKAFRSARGIGPRPDGRGSAIIADFRVKE